METLYTSERHFSGKKRDSRYFSDVEYNEVSLCSCLECVDIHDFKK